MFVDRYLDLPGTDKVNKQFLDNVENMAYAMSKEQILTTFSMNLKEFNESDKLFFDQAWEYGRGMGIHKAGQALKNAMQDSKQSLSAALVYLRRFNEEFPEEGGPVIGDGFSFQVKLDD